MTYDLDAFSLETRNILKTMPLQPALTEVATCLSRLLGNADFVRDTFNEGIEPGKRRLYYDPELDFYVFAHVQAAGKDGAPHSHGASWAVYGNAFAFTDMTEYERVNPETEECVILRKSDQYRLMPGQTRGYGPGVIHSTSHPLKAWVIRVTGTDLDHLPRYHFKKSRDTLLESA